MSTAELQETVFFILATVIVVCSILTVTTNRILRSATYLLFVLFATAGIYFQLEYSFLGAVQLTIYAGVSLSCTCSRYCSPRLTKSKVSRLKNNKMFAGLITALAGGGNMCLHHVNALVRSLRFVGGEINQKVIRTALMGTENTSTCSPSR